MTGHTNFERKRINDGVLQEKIVSKGRISAEKASMIAEGIQQFMKYSAQNRTFVEVTQEPSPQDTSGTPEWARSILFEADMLRESDENIKTGYKLARTAHYAMYSSSLSNAEVRASSPQILKGREENIDGGDQSSTKPNSIPITQNILPKSEECTSHNPVSRTVSVSHNSSLQNDFQNAFTTSTPTQNLMLDKIHVEPSVSNQTHSSSVTEKLGHVQQASNE